MQQKFPHCLGRGVQHNLNGPIILGKNKMVHKSNYLLLPMLHYTYLPDHFSHTAPDSSSLPICTEILQCALRRIVYGLGKPNLSVNNSFLITKAIVDGLCALTLCIGPKSRSRSKSIMKVIIWVGSPKWKQNNPPKLL
jgi:hypothetical protein